MTLSDDPAEIVAVDADSAREYLRAQLAGLAPAWHADALCREYDTALFFPGRGESSKPALAVCGRCAVRVECLDEAIADEALDFGVRGGKTAPQRRMLRQAERGRS